MQVNVVESIDSSPQRVQRSPSSSLTKIRKQGGRDLSTRCFRSTCLAGALAGLRDPAACPCCHVANAASMVLVERHLMKAVVVPPQAP